ncbi:DUF3017 domain-containing protein [Streptomyces sp. NPDC020965]|uniref:DUF3017 domain-containing protein n=1 Tax=Streptomyces sp. NPDC020965 TaxID=3365105 RepID=UPI0037B5854B
MPGGSREGTDEAGGGTGEAAADSGAPASGDEGAPASGDQDASASGDQDSGSPKSDSPGAPVSAAPGASDSATSDSDDPGNPDSDGPGAPDSDGPAASDSDDPGDQDSDGPEFGKAPSRRPPTLTTDTARPEGGGRAAPGDAPAPARQWPLLTVLALAGLGLLIVGLDPFAEAFRIGTILIGMALITSAVMRRVLPSVGMLAVRSRFTDMVTYGLLGVAITLLALVAQPGPWLELPFLEDIVRFTVRSDEPTVG